MRFLLLAFLFFSSPAFSAVETASIQLANVRLNDLSRVVFGDLLHRSFSIDSDLISAGELVTVNWLDQDYKTLDKLMAALLSDRGFQLLDADGVISIKRREFDKTDMLIYRPRYRSSKYLSDMLAKVAGVDQSGDRGFSPSPGISAAIQKMPEVEGSIASRFDRSAPDQVVYVCNPDKCAWLERLLNDLDTVEPQVLLRAAIYEVGTTKGEGSAVQVAANLLKGKFSLSAGSILAGAAQITLNTSLDAVLSVLDDDGRFNSISRPLLRVRTGAQATFSVGQQVPVLGSVSQDKNGNAVQSVEYRQSGTIFTVRPDIRDRVIDLDITQELSSFVNTTTGVNNSPTLLRRSASSQLSINPGEVVVFAGLEEQREDESKSGFFGWSLGHKKSKTSNEVLLFIEAESI